MGQLLRARANLLDSEPRGDAGSAELRAWIENEARLDERLQLARDLLFVKLDTTRSRHQAALLLLTIDLRDTLLASELDTDLLGQDAAGKQVRGVLIAGLHTYTAAPRRVEQAVRYGRTLATGSDLFAARPDRRRRCLS